MADYCCVWPVWGEGSGMHDGDKELPDSDALRQDLLDWQEFFGEHLHYENGWDTPRRMRSGCRAAVDYSTGCSAGWVSRWSSASIRRQL